MIPITLKQAKRQYTRLIVLPDYVINSWLRLPVRSGSLPIAFINDTPYPFGDETYIYPVLAQYLDMDECEVITQPVYVVFGRALHRQLQYMLADCSRASVSFPNSPDIGLAVKTCIKPIVNTFWDVQFPELDVAKLSKVIENKPLKPAFFKDRYYLMKYVTRNPHIYTNWLKEMQ